MISQNFGMKIHFDFSQFLNCSSEIHFEANSRLKIIVISFQNNVRKYRTKGHEPVFYYQRTKSRYYEAAQPKNQ